MREGRRYPFLQHGCLEKGGLTPFFLRLPSPIPSQGPRPGPPHYPLTAPRRGPRGWVVGEGPTRLAAAMGPPAVSC